MPNDNSGGGFVDKFVTLLGYKVNDAGLKQFKSGMKSAITTTKKLTKESRKSGQAASKSMAAGFKRGLRKIRVNFKLAIRAIKKWRRENEEQIKKVQESWNKMTDKGKNLLSFFGKLSAAVVGLTGVFGGLLAMTNKETAQIESLAKSVQVSSDFLRGMGSVVEEMGFSYENVVDMVEELNNKMGESTGLPEQMTAVKESLQILGLEFETLSKLKPEEQFTRILEEARKLKDHQQAVSAVDMLMGGEANKVVGLIREQNSEFDELLARRIKLSFLTKDGKDGAVAFNKSLAESLIVAQSMRAQFFGLVGQGLKPLLDGMNDWILQNRELIKTKIAEYAAKIVRSVKSFVLWVKEMIPKVKTWFELMGGLSGVLSKIKVVLMAIAGLKILGFISSMVTLFIDLKAVVGPAVTAIQSMGAAAGVSAGSMFLLLIPLALLVLAIQDLYTYFEGGDTLFGGWGEDFADALWFMNNESTAFWNGIFDMFGLNLRTVQKDWEKFVDDFVDKGHEKFDAFAEWIRDLLPNAFGDALQRSLDEIKRVFAPDILKNAIKGASNYVPFLAAKGDGPPVMTQGRGKAPSTTNKSTSVNQTNNISIPVQQNANPQEISAAVNTGIKKLMASAASSEGVG